MEEVLHLDGVQFADESMVGVEVGGGTGHYMEEQHMMMDTGGDEIVGLHEYDVGVGSDMPALGGEEEVLTVQPSASADTHPHHFSVSDDMELEQLVQSVKREYAELTQPPPPSALPVQPATQPLLQRMPQQTVQAVLQHQQLQPASRPVQVARASVGTREIAIAPKPAPAERRAAGAGAAGAGAAGAGAVSGGAKLLPLAKGAVVKKMAISGVVQSGKTLIGQLGKQQVMLVSGGARVKLVPASAATSSSVPSAAAASSAPVVHYIKTEQQAGGTGPGAGTVAATGNNPLLTKMLVQNSGGEPGTIMAKLMSGTGNNSTRYYTLQQQVSPSKWGTQQVLRVAKPRPQQLLSLKSPSRLLPGTAHGVATKKLVLSSGGGAGAGGGQGVVLRAASAGATAAAGATSQIHQINVPGKGVQYIRLVTTPSQRAGRAALAAPAAPAAALLALPAAAAAAAPAPATLLLPDAQASSRPQQKLVRIAPVTSKSAQHSLVGVPAAGRVAARPAQSLLAPRSPPRRPPATPAPAPPAPPDDSKAALRTIIAEMTAAPAHDHERAPEVLSSEAAELLAEAQGEGAEAEAEAEGEVEGDYEPTLTGTYLQGQEMDAELSTNIEEEYHTLEQSAQENGGEMALRPRKACNCTKSQCLKLYCDCFAGGEFCQRCNCTNCHNNLDSEELRQKAIRSCLERNPNAFRPKIGKGTSMVGPQPVRRHNKGCNCKRSGCLKNYCECYEAKIACTAICRCVGCRNIEERSERSRRTDNSWSEELPPLSSLTNYRPPLLSPHNKEPCSFMTCEVVEAVSQCMLAAGAARLEGYEQDGEDGERATLVDGISTVLNEFSRCLQDIIGAALHAHRPDELASVT